MSIKPGLHFARAELAKIRAEINEKPYSRWSRDPYLRGFKDALTEVGNRLRTAQRAAQDENTK